MDIPIQQMSLREYAEIQARFGGKILERDGHFWRQVRPFFYRPLLAVEPYDPGKVRRPVAWPSSFQYVVPAGPEANSTMNFIMLGQPQSYSLDSLLHKRRQMITRAGRDFRVAPLTSPAELKAHGHPIYLSFYERTGYKYKADRQSKAVFDRWVDTLFSCPKTILLGGYGPQGLAAISSSYWVNQTLVYSTLICDTGALRKNLGELMFHEIRQLAAKVPDIREIFVRPYQGGNSLDEYYLLRGCQLERRPARLELPSPVLRLMRWTMPRQYELLSGKD